MDAENAETFVRFRSSEKSQSALERMERQIAFLSAYGEKATQIYSKSPSLVTDLYEKLNHDVITNIGADQFVKVLRTFLLIRTRKSGIFRDKESKVRILMNIMWITRNCIKT